VIDIRSLRDLLRLFFIFQREFRWAVLITVVVAVLGAFLLPARYESNARLLVKPDRQNTTLPIEAQNRQTLVAPSTQRDPIVDEEKLLTGRPIVYQVAQRYLEETGAQQPTGFWKTLKHYAKRAGSAVLDGLRSVLQMLGIVEPQSDEQRLARKLEKNFQASHEAGSAVIDVRFVWDDPEVAQKILHTWIEVYMAERVRVLGRTSLRGFYQEEMNQTAERIRLLKEQRQQGLKLIDSISAKARLENLTNQIDRLTDARVTSQNERAGLSSLAGGARQQIGRLPAEVVTEREISLNPTQLDLKRQLNALQVERTRLLRTYTDEASPVRLIEQDIQNVQALVQQEQERLERSQNRAPNALANNARQQLMDAELRQQQLTAQIAEYDRELAALRKERDRVLGDEPELNRLQLELETAEKSFALYAENLEKARIDHALDTSQISNIAQIEQATLNPARVFPKSLMILLAMLPAAIGVGLLVVYICYLLDQRIHDGARIQQKFNVPLWASIPERDSADRHALDASVYRLYGLLPLEQIRAQGMALALTSARSGEGVSFIMDQLEPLLTEHGFVVRRGGDALPAPGELLLLNVSALLSKPDAFITLRRADLIALVVQARTSTVPRVENALSLLLTAFKKVDGIILNRRRFEVPARVMAAMQRWGGVQ
jgi:uncharacterized protein involved in exopolysaccharide biosynthesis